jgi:hypothetical protein
MPHVIIGSPFKDMQIVQHCRDYGLFIFIQSLSLLRSLKIRRVLRVFVFNLGLALSAAVNLKVA